MFISRTPLRISLFGGGTDFPSHYREHGGLVLSTTIDKYVYVIVKKRHDDTIRVSYSQTEIVDHVDDLQHDLIREAMKLTGVTSGVEIVTIADVAGHGSGLASSSAVTVGALHALSSFGAVPLFGQYLPDECKESLVAETIRIECDILNKTPGHQDQVSVVYGGLNRIEFLGDTYNVRGVSRGSFKWKGNLLLFKIATERNSSTILRDQDKRDNINSLLYLLAISEDALNALEYEQFDRLGPLLDESWQIKKTLSPHITNPRIDAMYDAARNAGASGGKVCGAGGGGYMLLYCPKGTHDSVRDAMREYGPELEFNFEQEGSTCKRLY